MDPLWIDRPEALAAACARWQTRPWIALDTEFLRADTYRARLCLVQVGDGETVACIDPLALADLGPLWRLIHDPGVCKVVHSGHQDLELVVEQTGQAPANVYDTQIAATLLGLGDQLGYAGLVALRLGIELDKSLARTDWARRPLSRAEIAYAAADVEHLAALYPALHAEVVQAGRAAWLAEENAALSETARYLPKPEQAWRRLKGLGRLDPAAQQRAAALAVWRERQAIAKNRPRKWILDDAPLYTLAERNPDSLAALEALKALPPKRLARYGEALLAVLAEANARPAQPLAQEELEGAVKARFKRLQSVVRETAERLNLPASFLANRSELEALARRETVGEGPVLEGWRGTLLGPALRQAWADPAVVTPSDRSTRSEMRSTEPRPSTVERLPWAR